jgi:hypothetical protein
MEWLKGGEHAATGLAAAWALTRFASFRIATVYLPKDQSDEGRPTRQRWRAGAGSVTVDFLIPPSLPGDQGGRLRDIEGDFAAIIAPGLKLAF